MAGLAAVAAWWNPSGSEERWRAHQTFKKRWPADIPLHVNPAFGTAPVWQKERLLNQAIAAIPSNIDRVIWCDADILIDSPTWAADISAALDKWPVIQPWTEATFQGPAGEPIAGPMGNETVPSVPFANDCRLALATATGETASPSGLPANAWPGFCWAARRDVLESIGGLYEYDLSGPNDVLMSLAFYGDFDNFFLMRYNGEFKRHFQPWATRAFEAVAGRVGYVPATLTHLWHGPFDGRRYLERTVRLYEAGYDPARHLVTAIDGTLALTDDCPPEVRRRAAACVGVTLDKPAE
jgi:hypothetical protein